MTQPAIAVAGVPTESSYAAVVSSSGMSYRPVLELGEGGMAKVYLAQAKGPGGFTKLVVLKSMHEADLEDEALRQMFVDEARLSARFNHPNLVQVQEVSLNTDPPFLVMEYLEGKPFSALRGSEKLTLGMRLAIISEVLTGLEHAHTMTDFDGAPLGIVHRDVSPHNVFVTYDGAVKVLDFGIAKVVTNSSRTEAGEVKGKLAYMAPEQMLGSTVDRRADVFSVGSMLWESAVGRRMWDGLSEAQLMHRLATGAIPAPSAHGSVDPELEAIIVKATAADPQERFASAHELQRELDSYRARSGEHCSAREIGLLLADSYQTERRRNAELISAALQHSLPPAPAFEPEEAQSEEPASTGRAKWLLVGALLLLAGAGLFASQRFAREPSSSLLAAPQPSLRPVELPAPPSMAAPSAPSEPAPSEAPAASSAKPRRTVERAVTRSAPRAAAPSGPATPSAVETAAPTPEQSCNPPFYFVRGIKTYKPECL